MKRTNSHWIYWKTSLNSWCRQLQAILVQLHAQFDALELAFVEKEKADSPLAIFRVTWKHSLQRRKFCRKSMRVTELSRGPADYHAWSYSIHLVVEIKKPNTNWSPCFVFSGALVELSHLYLLLNVPPFTCIPLRGSRSIE